VWIERSSSVLLGDSVRVGKENSRVYHGGYGGGGGEYGGIGPFKTRQ